MLRDTHCYRKSWKEVKLQRSRFYKFWSVFAVREVLIVWSVHRVLGRYQLSRLPQWTAGGELDINVCIGACSDIGAGQVTDIRWGELSTLYGRYSVE